jgi:hypothetical protein
MGNKKKTLISMCVCIVLEKKTLTKKKGFRGMFSLPKCLCVKALWERKETEL